MFLGIGMGLLNLNTIWQKRFKKGITAIQVEDIDKDGKSEILVGFYSGSLRVFNLDGEELWRKSLGTSSSISYILAYDINNDGYCEILCEGASSVLRALDWQGEELWQRKFNFSPGPIHPYDLNNDGYYELIVGATPSRTLTVLTHNGLTLWRKTFRHSVKPEVVFDINGDESAEIIIYERTEMTGETGIIKVLNAIGNQIKKFLVKEFAALDVADFDNDSEYEIIIGTREGYLRVVKLDGKNLWKKKFDESILELITWDLNADDNDEIILKTYRRSDDTSLLAAYNNEKKPLFKRRMHDISYFDIFDVTRDEKNEVIAISKNGTLNILKYNGQLLLSTRIGHAIEEYGEPYKLCVSFKGKNGTPIIAVGGIDGSLQVFEIST